MDENPNTRARMSREMTRNTIIGFPPFDKFVQKYLKGLLLYVNRKIGNNLMVQNQ
jgi:hypothetical protein